MSEKIVHYKENEVLYIENIEVNSKGGKGTKLLYDFTLMDPHVNEILANVLKYGADKYGKDNWRNVSVREHLNHALGHINNALYVLPSREAEPDADNIYMLEDLAHAMTRLHMAVAVYLQDYYENYNFEEWKGEQV